MKTTLGQQRVRLDFNPGGNTEVNELKSDTAKLIDRLQAHHNDEVSKSYDLSPHEKMQISGEKLRLIEKAQEYYEIACMLAVKAVTS